MVREAGEQSSPYPDRIKYDLNSMIIRLAFDEGKGLSRGDYECIEEIT